MSIENYKEKRYEEDLDVAIILHLFSVSYPMSPICHYIYIYISVHDKKLSELGPLHT